MQTITNLLMFTGQAEEAMNFYLGLFDDSRLIVIQKYGPNEQGPEGTVMYARFTLAGQVFACIDSPVKHDFTFTAATTFRIDCDAEEEVDRIFGRLTAGGQVFMPLNKYPFSEKFGWTADKYGVSWQVSIRAKR